MIASRFLTSGDTAIPSAPFSERWRQRWALVNSHLLTALIFSLPISTAASNIFAALMLIGWLARADFGNDWRRIRRHRMVLAAAGFFALHLLGMLWTENLGEGWAQIRKEWKFALLPVFIACVQRHHVDRYLAAFVTALAIAVAISFAIYFEFVPPINKATVDNPVPFGTHVVYGPLLALASYLLGSRILFGGDLAKWQRGLLALVLAAMCAGLFITDGRAGQVAFFVLAVVLCLQYGGLSLRSMLLAAVLVFGTFAVAYFGNDDFRHRTVAAMTGDAYLGGRYDVSVDERLAYLRNGLQVIRDHPLIGVGSGDLVDEMARRHEENQSNVRLRRNPHNMYILMAGQFGALGLASLLWLFLAQIRCARTQTEPGVVARLGLALPIVFLILCFAESYLAVHATSLLFCVFSAFLYEGEHEGVKGGLRRP